MRTVMLSQQLLQKNFKDYSNARVINLLYRFFFFSLRDNQEMSEIILDCFGSIVEFLHSPEILLNLLLINKRFNKFIRFSYPLCCRNIDFHLNLDSFCDSDEEEEGEGEEEKKECRIEKKVDNLDEQIEVKTFVIKLTVSYRKYVHTIGSKLASFPNLRELTLEEVFVCGKDLFDFVPNLLTLNLYDCNIEDEVFRCLKKLKRLVVDNSHIYLYPRYHSNRNWTKRDLKEQVLSDNCLKYFKNLTYLDLCCCSSFSNDGFSNLSGLKTLKLYRCPNITDNIFEFGFLELEKLKLKLCHSIEVPGFKKIMKNVKLQDIKVYGCAKIALGPNEAEDFLKFKKKFEYVPFTRYYKYTTRGYVGVSVDYNELDLVDCGKRSVINVTQENRKIDSSHFVLKRIYNFGYYTEKVSIECHLFRGLIKEKEVFIRKFRTFDIMEFVNCIRGDDSPPADFIERVNKIKNVYSKNIVKTIDGFFSKGDFYVIKEYFECKNLGDCLREKENISVYTKISLIKQLISGCYELMKVGKRCLLASFNYKNILISKINDLKIDVSCIIPYYQDYYFTGHFLDDFFILSVFIFVIVSWEYVPIDKLFNHKISFHIIDGNYKCKIREIIEKKIEKHKVKHTVLVIDIIKEMWEKHEGFKKELEWITNENKDLNKRRENVKLKIIEEFSKLLGKFNKNFPNNIEEYS